MTINSHCLHVIHHAHVLILSTNSLKALQTRKHIAISGWFFLLCVLLGWPCVCYPYHVLEAGLMFCACGDIERIKKKVLYCVRALMPRCVLCAHETCESLITPSCVCLSYAQIAL